MGKTKFMFSCLRFVFFSQTDIIMDHIISWNISIMAELLYRDNICIWNRIEYRIVSYSVIPVSTAGFSRTFLAEIAACALLNVMLWSSRIIHRVHQSSEAV